MDASGLWDRARAIDTMDRRTRRRRLADPFRAVTFCCHRLDPLFQSGTASGAPGRRTGGKKGGEHRDEGSGMLYE